MISSDFSPEYPASAQRCCLVCPRGFLIRFFRTSSTCVTSCRLAPVTTIDNGTPRSSTRICRLVPFFSPISRIWPYRFLCSRGFYHCSVDTLPCPCNSFHFIIFSKSFLPEFTEKSEWFPFSEITMHTAGTAIFFRQGFLLNACAQNIYDCLKNPAGFHRFATTSASPLITFFRITFHFRYQGSNPRPKFIRHFPWFDCHIHLPRYRMQI